MLGFATTVRQHGDFARPRQHDAGARRARSGRGPLPDGSHGTSPANSTARLDEDFCFNANAAGLLLRGTSSATAPGARDAGTPLIRRPAWR
ncbi:hypothetical protein ACPA9J_04065 [Pseudomonas aeruginosa]